MSKPVTKMVPINELRAAPYNPPGRTIPSAIKDLRQSMEKIGLMQSVIVTPDYQIIEGHRRVTVARNLGWREIECKIVSEHDAALIYSTMNISARPMRGSEALYVYLHSSQATPTKFTRVFSEMDRVLGRPLLKRIARAGYSANLYNRAKQVAQYCQIEDQVPKIVEWFLAHPVTGNVMRALGNGVQPSIIRSAIKKNRPVSLSLAVA